MSDVENTQSEKNVMDGRMREIRSAVIQALSDMENRDTSTPVTTTSPANASSSLNLTPAPSRQEASSEVSTPPSPVPEAALPEKKLTLLERTIIKTVEPLVMVWLDKHLYGLVERIVREEVSRFSKKDRRD